MRKLFTWIIIGLFSIFCCVEYLPLFFPFNLQVVKKFYHFNSYVFLIAQKEGFLSDNIYWVSIDKNKAINLTYYRSNLLNDIYFSFHKKPLYLFKFSILGDENDIRITYGDKKLFLEFSENQNNHDNFFEPLEAKCVKSILNSKVKITCSLIN